MRQAVKQTAVYEDLYAIPDNMTGEIINGELIVTPRPSVKHANAAFALSGHLAPPYSFGWGGGPGGWVILYEPEIMLGDELLVPDFAGWRKERFPGVPKENWVSVSPDWVCEILSPSTMRVDRIRKMPIYARFGVAHLWLMDPVARTLEVFRLESERWSMTAAFAENEKVRAEPFQEIEFDLGPFWMD